MKKLVAAVAAFLGKFFSKSDMVAAGHTLWQSAVGSGGIALVVDSVSKRGVNLTLAEQGLGVIGTAVAASLGSLVKAYFKTARSRAALAELVASVERMTRHGEAAQSAHAGLKATTDALTVAIVAKDSASPALAAAAKSAASVAKKLPAKKAPAVKKAVPAKKAPANKALAKKAATVEPKGI